MSRSHHELCGCGTSSQVRAAFAAVPRLAPGDEQVTRDVVGQVDVEMLARFAEAGVLPRRTLVVRRTGATTSVRGQGSEIVLDLPDDVARHLFVARS